MAGHVRTTATGKARRTSGGRLRQTREPVPPEQRADAKRAKQHRGARAIANDRITSATDEREQLAAAREYLMSAMAKYDSPATVRMAVAALLKAGDLVFTTGTPHTAFTRRRRKQEAEQHRTKRRVAKVLIAKGRAAVRREQAEAGA